MPAVVALAGAVISMPMGLPLRVKLSRGDHPPTFHDVAMVGRGFLKHRTEIDLCKATVLHPLQDVWNQLQLPVPPRRRRALRTQGP